MKISILATILISLFACATPYQPLSFSGGYTDMQVGRGKFFITVEGNGFTSSSTVQRYLHRRAYELCSQHGFTAYSLTNADKDTTENISISENKRKTTISSVKKHSVSATVVCTRN